MVERGSACDAASWTSRRGTPASSAAVMKAWRRVWGPIGLGDPGPAGAPAHEPSRPVTVETPTAGGDEDRALGPLVDSQVDRPCGPRRKRDDHGLATLSKDSEGPMASLPPVYRSYCGTGAAIVDMNNRVCSRESVIGGGCRCPWHSWALPYRLGRRTATRSCCSPGRPWRFAPGSPDTRLRAPVAEQHCARRLLSTLVQPRGPPSKRR